MKKETKEKTLKIEWILFYDLWKICVWYADFFKQKFTVVNKWFVSKDRLIEICYWDNELDIRADNFKKTYSKEKKYTADEFVEFTKFITLIFKE